MSLNVNGFKVKNRRDKLISHYFYPVNKLLKPDVFCLQECGLTEEDEKDVLKALQYDLVFAHAPNQVRKGLMTGFRRDMDYVVHDFRNILHSKSQALVVYCSIEKFDYVIVNFYCYPTESQGELLSLFSVVKENIVTFDCNKVLWCGDFNTTLEDIDHTGNNLSSHNAINRALVPVLDSCEFVDAFCILNPSDRRFTFIHKKYGARLDYIFASLDVVNCVEESNIGVAFVTDHAPVFAKIFNGRNPSGRNYWKFPNYLVHCNEYKDALRKEISIIVARNKGSVSPSTLWDFLKQQIKQFTTKFVKDKNFCKKNRIEDMERRIFELNSQLPKISGDQFENVKKQIFECINHLNIIHKVDWKEYYIGRMQECNERSSKLFFKRIRATPGSINRLKNKNNELVSLDSEILDVCTDFYEELFRDERIAQIDDAVTEDSFSLDGSNDAGGDEPYGFLPDNGSLRLNPNDKQMLSEEVSYEEIRQAIMKMRKGKAPGYDGLSVDFYHKFFDVVGEHLHDSLQYAFEKGELSISQKRGIIKLIPKKDKDSTLVRNLRPITLLNVDVKALSKALAHRVQSVVHQLINKDQTPIIQGRNIGENILDVYALISAAEDNEENDILIFLDIEKAYDTVNWCFLTAVLSGLGFPDSFVRWVEILHKNKEIRFFNNGYSSKPVHPQKGLAQGCGLSLLLFVIAMSRLSEVLNKNVQLEGIKCAGREKKCCLAADDTVVGIKATVDNLVMLLRILDLFYYHSGLKVNYNKSIIMRIGCWKNSRRKIDVSTDFLWATPGEKVRYLGIFLSAFSPHGNSIEFNPDVCMDASDIVSIVKGLRYQRLSIIGKILILKSLIASKLVYKFLHYPTPNARTMQWLNKLYFDFIWEGRHRISAHEMIQPLEKGGFNMLDVFIQQQSLQFNWLAKTLSNVNEKALWEHCLRDYLLIPLQDAL